MFCMQKGVRFSQVPMIIIVLAGALMNSNIAASALSLIVVEELALAADPAVRSVESDRLALEEM